MDILIENNNIISSIATWYSNAIYVHSDSGTKVKLNMSGNNITAMHATNDPSCIYLDLNASDNTLIFENNNFLGLGWGAIHIVATDGNNTILINNNNITETGTWSGTHDIYMGISRSKNIITITNNNITGKSDSGIWISAGSANTTLTVSNNNITASEYYGVYINFDKGINTINFNDNNISKTGADYNTVYINVINSQSLMSFVNNKIVTTETSSNVVPVCIVMKNNSNTINFTNNKIISRDSTAFLIQSNGNNTNDIRLVGNTIFSDKYALSLEVNASTDFSGLLIKNNTFNSSDTALFFVSREGARITDINIIGNNIFADKKAFSFLGGIVSMNANYNRILSPLGLDFTSVINDISCNFDYNWWGINDIGDKILGFITNNHFILNITNLSSIDNTFVGDKVYFALLVLNTTLNNQGVENFPYFVINGTFDGIDYISTWDDRFVYQIVVLSEGLHFIDASLDDQYVDLSFFVKISTGLVENPNIDNGTGTNIKDDFINEKTDKLKKSFNKNLGDKTNKNTIDETSDSKIGFDNTSVASAAMKSTGVPIFAVSLFVLLFLASYRRNF
jgi:hypothetical protein